MNALSTVKKVLPQRKQSNIPSIEVDGTTKKRRSTTTELYPPVRVNIIFNRLEKVYRRTRLICGYFEMEVT